MKRLILLITFLLCASQVEAALYTVCSSGCDHTTIQAAFDGHDLDGDDIVEVRADTPGVSKTYAEMVTWGELDGGSSGHPVILRARAGDTITITGSDVRDHAIWDNYKGVSYITISGFIVTATDLQAIYFCYGTGVVVQGCTVHHNGEEIDGPYSDGIQFVQVTSGLNQII